jgi:ribosomal protein L11 methyltransferase
MMRWIEVKVVFNFNDRQLAVDLISDLFYDLDLKGVVVEESQVEGFEDWGSHAHIPENDAIIGYLPDDDTLRKKRKTLEEGLARLEKKIGIQYRMFCRDVDEADWAESWKSYFHPEKITDRIVVKPTWQDYLHNEKEIVLEIDPGMAFGTGTHPTTRMCIALIEKYLRKSDTFLDVGTGSGILMIAAAKLGADKMLGTDHDAVAAQIARKNLMHNQIPESTFTIIAGDLVAGITRRFDLAAANLTTKAVSILLEHIPKILAKDGIFICSGILLADKNKILAKIKHAGLQIIDILVDDDWIAMASRRV